MEDNQIKVKLPNRVVPSPVGQTAAGVANQNAVVLRPSVGASPMSLRGVG